MESEEESIPWEILARDRIKKHGKAGLVLRGARFMVGISQKELAQRSGVSQKTISKIENRNANFKAKTARKLATALGINPRLLLDDTGLE